MDRPTLGIDTATRGASIALEGVPAPQVRLLTEKGAHARDLLGAIETLLRDAGVARRELGGIGVAAGPGSFTGVRIGLATAKGLGLALDIPVEGVSTLEAMAHAVADASFAPIGVIGVVLEAGRGEVYAALFAPGDAGMARLSRDAAWKPAELVATLPVAAILAGDGVPLLRRVGAAHQEAPVPALAPAIARLARARVLEGTGYRVGGSGPNYVRPSDAATTPKRPS